MRSERKIGRRGRRCCRLWRRGTNAESCCLDRIHRGKRGLLDFLVQIFVRLEGLFGSVPTLGQLIALETEPAAAFIDDAFFQGDVDELADI